MRNTGGRLIALGTFVFAAAITTAMCAKPSSSSQSGSQTQPAGSKPTLYGEMTPVFSVKELMGHMIDPVSDNIFDAVWWDTTAKGVVEHKPVTDDDWDKVRMGAVTIIEGIDLLKEARLLAPAGDVNNSKGPNAPELSPTQIREKIDKDPVLWIAKIQALRNVGLEVLEIANKKDTGALWQAGGDLDEACEACHLEYWYPGDKETVLRERKNRVRIEKPVKGITPTR